MQTLQTLPLGLLLATALLLPAACAHDFTVENRETPVHVWLTAPDLANTGGTLDALIYVGAEKAIEGPVRFPPGVLHVALPTLYVTSGDRVVSAVLEGGAISATDEVDIDGETWIQVTVQRRGVTIRDLDRPPNSR